MRALPILVGKLTQFCDAWIVGSAADPDVDFSAVRDFDIAVPFGSWHLAASLIPATATPNSFGGWKCESEGAIVDVWPQDLTHFVTNHVSSPYLFHPRSGTRLMKEVA